MLRKQGVAIEIEDLCELMLEFDCDSNAKLDIDEFITMMQMGD